MKIKPKIKSQIGIYSLTVLSSLIGFLLINLISFQSLASSQAVKSNEPKRNINSEQEVISLAYEIKDFGQEVENANIFNSRTCEGVLKGAYKNIYKFKPEGFDLDDVKKNWLSQYNQVWAVRVKLREKVLSFVQAAGSDYASVKPCVVAAREMNRALRWIEDYLAENFSGEAQDFKAGNPKFEADPNFKLSPLQGKSPWLLIAPKSSGSQESLGMRQFSGSQQLQQPADSLIGQEVKIKSGDMILSRGGAYTSAAISRITDVDSQFSHLAVIYIPGLPNQELTIAQALKRKNVLVLEAHIEIGSTIRPLADYFADKNARNMLLRFQDPVKAHAGAEWTYKFIQKFRSDERKRNPGFASDDVNYNVPYNFKMDLQNFRNPKELFCSQVGYVGLKNVGVDIPMFMSTLNPKTSLPRMMGIQNTTMFSPSDIEFDPRFSLLAEYRNIRKLKSLRIKDMILTSAFRWMDQLKYELRPDLKINAKALSAWTMRHLDIKMTKEKLPKNMNTKILRGVLTLEKVSSALELDYEKAEAEFRKSNRGLAMGYLQGLMYLEKKRAEDLNRYKFGRASIIHNNLRP
jgi:hypothetical protein